MNVKNILETINMIEEQKLDIRTITMGISLLDCIDSDGEKAREKIYKKITTCAKDLVKVGQEIESEFGIPIVNKRVSVTPISIIAGACDDKDYVEFAKVLDKAAEELGIDFIGGFSALCQKQQLRCDGSRDALDNGQSCFSKLGNEHAAVYYNCCRCPVFQPCTMENSARIS